MAKTQVFYIIWWNKENRRWNVGWRTWFRWHVCDYFHDADNGIQKAKEAFKTLGADNIRANKFLFPPI